VYAVRRPDRAAGAPDPTVWPYTTIADGQSSVNCGGSRMTAVSLIFLVLCIFGAFAYGSATLMAVRQSAPVWSTPGGAGRRAPVDRVSLTMFVVCTVWFALNAVSELGVLTQPGWSRSSRADLAVFVIAFVFPPLIMHVVYRETVCDGHARYNAWWRRLLVAMYLVSPAAGVYLIGGALGLIARPEPFGRIVGLAFAALYTIASLYSTLIMLNRRHAEAMPRRSAKYRLGNAMLSLFVFLSLVFLTVAMLGEQSALVALFERITRTSPLLFLIVAMYFENRFDFYDLVIKRGVMLVTTVLALSGVFALGQPVLDAIPSSPVRPWLMAIVLMPIAMVMPWLYQQLSAALDRLWFGRQFSAVDAVKHLLGAMQPATDEASLVQEAERRLGDIFGTPITVSLDDAVAAERPGVDVEASTPSGARVRLRFERGDGTRRLLSEDLQMLRSLASVFGFMLETVRLQHKRQEQELVAQELRLQTSRSELKALRAQINPHFLFNALNAIASLIHTDPSRADEAVEQLAEVFRYTLRRSDSEWAPLDQELAFARAYLDVERARFGSRLSCVIDSDHLLPPPLVPSMLLQTLIENAVKHGVSQTRGPGRIEVIVRTTASEIVVEVRDNGPGPGAAPTMPRESTGFGLRSVRERLAGHFGERAELSLIRDAANATTVARIVMPIVRVAA
jgi:signal transduction histidine kinase